MQQSTRLMRIAKTGYIILSLALGILGLMIIIKPQYLTINNLRIGGIICILFGVIKILGYFSHDLYRLAFQFDLEIGIINIVLGLIVCTSFIQSISITCIILSILVLVDSLFKIRISLDAKEFGISSWWVILIVGFCLSILSGGLFLWFDNNQIINRVLFGMVLTAEGFLNLITAVTTIKIIKNQRKDSL